ncbi:DUF3870 domain-containing protein [Hungatella sp.]|uniref:DUF3870 domain-containing protein n=1 Tax=Hungatella sp. TaxID=2613924 RepID=UPI003995FA14
MFVGKSLRTDVPLIEKEIGERYFALTQKPLIACMKDACNSRLPHGDRGKLAENNGVQMRKQENRIFNIIKPEFSSGCFSSRFSRDRLTIKKIMIKLGRSFF